MKTTNLFHKIRILAISCAVSCTLTSNLPGQQLQPAFSSRNGAPQPVQHPEKQETTSSNEQDSSDPPIVTVAQLNESNDSSVPIVSPQMIKSEERQLFKAKPLQPTAQQFGVNGPIRTAEMIEDLDSQESVITASHLQQGPYAQQPYNQGGPTNFQPRSPGLFNSRSTSNQQIFPGNTQAGNPLAPRVPVIPSSRNLFGRNQDDQSVPIVSPDGGAQPTFQLPAPGNSQDLSVPGPNFQQEQSVLNSATPHFEAPGQGNYNGQSYQNYDHGYQNNEGYGVYQSHVQPGYPGEPGCDDCGDNVDEYFKCCGFVCDACSYFIGEALYWQRDNGRIIGTNMFRTDDFDDQWGGRFTYGRRWDEMSGWEVSVMGFDAFLANSEQRDPGARLAANLVGTPTGFNNSFFTSFRNARFIDQRQKSNLFSVESNKVWFGWDVAKFFYGVRYINFDDDFRMTSRNIINQAGFYDMQLDNDMYGAHIGGEIFHDVGYRLSFSYKAKAGAYVNFIDGSTVFLNNGTPVLANGANRTDISYSLEAGVTAHYQLLPRLRVIGGYEVLSLIDVATTLRNFDSVQTPSTGTFYSNNADAVFHGFNVGIEWYR